MKAPKMREIEFRGKSEDGTFCNNKGWCYGGYVNDKEGTWIVLCLIDGGIKYKDEQIVPPNEEEIIHTAVPVLRNTVGQYTGLNDKNGVKIFEGDIVRYTESPLYDPEVFLGDVSFKNGCFMVNFPTSLEYLGDSAFEVIGNIHDSPELLEEK
ncbi:MAG: YopX family protein [Spirochaetaceae bacterium]|jgi:hypothetical protein|nr:YopX family protein [Spirochaetaceae bacterium]